MLTGNKLVYFVVVAMLIVGVIVYPSLPEQVPVHWNVQGQPDRFGDRLFAVAFWPLATLFLNFVLRSRYISSLVKDEGTDAILHFSINLMALFLTYMHIITLGVGLGWQINVIRAVLPAVGLLLILLGNVMGRAQPNWVVGFRVWWTVNHPEVWRRTHRVAARWLVVDGVIVMLLGLFASLQAALVAVLVLLVGGSAVILWYSYRIYQQVRETGI
jgi:uncharacterized membrane protein